MTSLPPSPPPSLRRERPAVSRYWVANLRLMAVLLALWAAAGLGAGVLLADRLSALPLALGGFPLGFWFAQQGAIVAFILLILAYALAMNRLDARHRRDRLDPGRPGPAR
jgi:putative solute:sodium symporter small subunit